VRFWDREEELAGFLPEALLSLTVSITYEVYFGRVSADAEEME
jgi:hypothetical protein